MMDKKMPDTDEKKRLIIIDSNALLHRSFHALPPLTTKKGEQTGAVYGFFLTLFKTIKDLKPNYIIACFDTAAPTFRHEQFKEYKAQRPKTSEELITQIPKTKQVLTGFNIPVFEKEGFEADDLIATISQKASNPSPLAKGEGSKEKLEVYILSGDLDNLQLVNENIKVYTLGKGIKETVVYDREKVRTRFGVEPEQMNDFKALIGDPSDNVPGVLGIGKKTAAELLKKFNSLENLYQEVEKDNPEIKTKTKETLLKNKKQALLSRFLVETKKDVDININITECEFGKFDCQKVESILKELEFFTLINRVPSLVPGLDSSTSNLKLQ